MSDPIEPTSEQRAAAWRAVNEAFAAREKAMLSDANRVPGIVEMLADWGAGLLAERDETATQIQRLKEERDTLGQAFGGAFAEIKKLETERDRLREALRPLADLVPYFREYTDESVLWSIGSEPRLRVKHLRDAAREIEMIQSSQPPR
jgi:hypothetical protein